MKKLAIWFISAVLVAVMLVPVLPAQAGGPIGPADMLSVYYSLINNRDYLTAYNQWVAPPQTYQSFVAGYGDTSNIAAFFGGFQPAGVGQLEGGVPSLLIGYRYNGSVAAYRGCYFVRYDASASGMGTWRITGANIEPLEMVPAPETYINYLDYDCYERTTPSGFYTTVQQVLVTYYDAINRGDYLRAYNLWVNPPQTYQDFVTGFQDTTEIVLFYGNYQFSGNYATLETGRIPVYLMGYHTDGSVGLYQGCFSVNYNAQAAPYWRIAGANLRQVTAYAYPPSAWLIQQVLNGSCY